MKFNKYIGDKNNYITGGNVVTENANKIAIGLVVVAIIVISCAVFFDVKKAFKSKENFYVYNNTVDPKLIDDPKFMVQHGRHVKKNLYDSSNDFNDETQESGEQLAERVREIQAPRPPVKAVARTGWEYENFQGRSGYDRSVDADDGYSSPSDSCPRPQFMSDVLNDEVLSRSWLYKHENCPTLELSQTEWALKTADSALSSSDSITVPFRSVPENTIIENPISPSAGRSISVNMPSSINVMPPDTVHNDVSPDNLRLSLTDTGDDVRESFQNQNLLLYNTGNEREVNVDKKDFDQTTQCCHRSNSAAHVFQNMDENDLKNSLRLLDYMSGEIHHERINDSKYDEVAELPTISNQKKATLNDSVK